MPPAPTGRAYLRFVLVLGALIAIGPLTIDTYLPALPSITRDLAASESAVQLTLTGILLYSKKGMARRQHFRQFRTDQRLRLRGD